jgi:hypothetical protein
VLVLPIRHDPRWLSGTGPCPAGGETLGVRDVGERQRRHGGANLACYKLGSVNDKTSALRVYP